MVFRFVVLSTLLLLGACQSTQPKIALDPAAHQQAVRGLNGFSVTGGLSVWTDQESVSARIEWKQLGNDFDALMSLPAGLSTVQVTRKNGLASVKNGAMQPEVGRSAGVLVQQALGLSVAVPIEQMAAWIIGLPGDAAQSVQYDNQGRLVSMDYVDGQNTLWYAQILQYTSHEGVDVPSIVRATGGPYTVRLTLKKWNKLTSVEQIQDLSQPTPSKGRLKVPGR